MRGLVERLRRLDERAVPAPGRASRGVLVVALLAGLLAAGAPAACVLVAGGPVLVAALLPLLAVVPVVLVLLSR